MSLGWTGASLALIARFTGSEFCLSPMPFLHRRKKDPFRGHPCPFVESRFRTPQGTRLLTLEGLLIRDYESFGREFWTAIDSFKVPFAP